MKENKRKTLGEQRARLAMERQVARNAGKVAVPGVQSGWWRNSHNGKYEWYEVPNSAIKSEATDRMREYDDLSPTERDREKKRNYNEV